MWIQQNTLAVTETPMFMRYAAAVWSDDEREEFVDFIATNPEAGDAIPEFAPLRELRKLLE